MSDALGQRDLHALFMHTPVPICILHVPGLVFTLANQSFLDATARGPEIVGMSLVEAFPGADVRGYEQRLLEIVRGGVTVIEKEAKRSGYHHGPNDAKFLYWDFTYQPIAGPDGAIDSLMIVSHDVTDQVLARQVIEKARTRLEFLEKASSILQESLDYERTLRRVAECTVPNIADWCTVSAYDVEGVFRRVAVVHRDPEQRELAELYEHSVPPDRHRNESLMLSLSSGKSVLHSVVTDDQLVAAAQDEAHLRVLRGLGCASCIIVPMLVRGEAVGLISLMRADASNRYDDDDLALAEELAARAALAVDNARLYHNAQNAVRMRDEFLSIASHELRTPLTSLQLQVNSMQRNMHRAKDDTTFAKLAMRVDSVDRHVERLGKLVNELLDVSRASVGRLQLNPERVNLLSVVEEVAYRFQNELALAGCQLTLELEEVEGHWDRMRLDQILTNFLSNALKYARGKPIEVSTQLKSDKGVLTVRDHGIGIAIEDQARIFDRYVRAVPSEHYGGLGLGLWIVRVYVEAMGGTVTVNSRPGHGAMFVVELPLEGRVSTNPVH